MQIKGVIEIIQASFMIIGLIIVLPPIFIVKAIRFLRE